ncbi:uncharacterized protein [Haliotis cracherodii]|uniref:uncharacterized protein n=1 Tax=Haliotis cracherodii TaxID=6455 RepID=UPI0039EC1E37
MAQDKMKFLYKQVSSKIKDIEYLMSSDADLDAVKNEFEDWKELCDKFQESAKAYHEKLHSQSAKDDEATWFQSKLCTFSQFERNVTSFIKHYSTGDDIRPEDSVSQVGLPKGSVISSASSAKMEILAKRAELIARQKCLERRHQLEEEENRLKQRRERLELETEVEIADAQYEIFDQYDRESHSSRKPESSLRPFKQVKTRNKDLNPEAEEFTPIQSTNLQVGVHNSKFDEVCKQQNEIIQLVVEHQKLATLPTRKIPVFSGDPLQFKPFIQAFEHGIEDKTINPKDRLYYLDQYTNGEPNDLVRSCLFMNPESGYEQARTLLDKKFGNKYKIATAYMDKALKWPAIKSEDSEALNSFAVFLTSCGNTMTDIDYLRELEHPKNIRELIQKLPYKLRERWRTVSFNILERRNVTFADLVGFVDKQAQILSSPLFGNIIDDIQVQARPKMKEAPKRYKSFATDTSKSELGQETATRAAYPVQPKLMTSGKPSATRERTANTSRAFIKPCWFCNEDHTMEMCKGMQCKTLDEKTDFLRPKGLCFGCLQFGHMSRECPSRLTCHICKLRHATCFHDNGKDREKKEMDQTKPRVVTNNSLATSESGDHKDLSYMPVVPVRIKVNSGDRYVKTYAFLDNGSSATFCTSKLAEELQVTGKMTNIVVSTMTQRKTVNTSILSNLEVGDIDGNNWVKLPTVFTQDEMPISTSTVPKEKFIHQWPHLQDVTLPPIDAEIGLLIGNNVPRAMEPYEIINSDGNGPYAVRTILGWIVNGLVQESESPSEISVNRTDVLGDEKLDLQLIGYFNREFNERISNDQPEMSRDDKQFLDIMNSSKTLTGGHYQMSLPFKDAQLDLPNNKVQAEQRAISLKKKFKKNENFYEDYKVFMKDLLDKDYAQKVPENKKDRKDGKVWYIPHHGVYHPKKPEKIRVVFDCAATFRGKSLNDHLLQGPDLTNTLLGVLLRFRQEPIALMADIEAMFYQVRVEPDDYDVLRFLWWPNGNLEEELQEYQMKVHLFGAVSSPSCANFALKETAKDNMDLFGKEVVHAVEKSFYVDDCLTSVQSEKMAIEMSHKLREICKKGGFRLTKWISNSRAAIESIPGEERAKEVKDLDMDDALPIERALGVHWCVESDTFKFRIAIKDKPITRRGILSTVSSIYDPLGFAGPYVLKAKGILQDLCRLKIGWDDVIPVPLQKDWTKWLSELRRLEEMAIRRCIQPNDSNQKMVSQIHHFSDASETGYGTVSYLRQVSSTGQIHCAFLISKSRVAPLKQITIPRMELSAATLAIRVDSMLKRELEMPIDQTYFWSDSMSVLRYIANDSKRFHTFVANRLSVIHEGSSPSQWKYVDTQNNPADEASRGLSIDAFLKDTRWLSGPKFLWEDEEMWPQQTHILTDIPKKDVELKKVARVNLIDYSKPCKEIDSLISHYSDWFALKKAIAWVLRIREVLLDRSQKKKAGLAPQQSMPVVLTVKDLENAEKAIVCYVQQQDFSSELERLNSNKELDLNKGSPISKLDPFVEDGVLRVGGRLSRANMPESSKHPLILPKKSHVSELIIRHVHRECGHSGRNFVLSKLFEKYWIIKANAAVRQEIHRCVTCRRNQVVAGKQKMADLPAQRVTPDEPPFTFVGVDYFGPFDVKRGRKHEKRYGVLFTCLTTRAVHIEVAYSLDTDSCINALRRFMARRGQVKVIRSDNGTNFVGSERELREELENWNKCQIHQEMLQRNVEWTFNPPAGSHHGGVWERQIRTVRKVLRSLVREQTLDDETLRTVLCEVEAIINNRPISRASSDPNDLEALTPNHLLLLKRKPNLPPGMFGMDGHYPRRRWRQVQYMADLFWKRWLREYLPLLQERQKWVKLRRNLKIGDIVLIVDNTAPRNSWSMGKVVKLMPDRKGVVRRVEVKTQTKVLDRPISKLCLLLESDT